MFHRQTGPFPAGVILHSYMGSAEMVPELSNLGSYFSFSGFLTSMKEQKVKKMLKSVSAPLPRGGSLIPLLPSKVNKQKKKDRKRQNAAKFICLFRYQKTEF